jgi:hypothetical protein
MYIVEIQLDIARAFWQPQGPGDTPRCRQAVIAPSAKAALRCIEAVYPGRPMRIVPRL